MRKALMFFLAGALLLIAAVFWTVGRAPVVMGGKEIVAIFRPEVLVLFFGALSLFAIGLVLAIHAAVRAWTHRAAPAETRAPSEERAPAGG